MSFWRDGSTGRAIQGAGRGGALCRLCWSQGRSSRVSQAQRLPVGAGCDGRPGLFGDRPGGVSHDAGAEFGALGSRCSTPSGTCSAGWGRGRSRHERAAASSLHPSCDLQDVIAGRCRSREVAAPFGGTATKGCHVRLLPAHSPAASTFDAERLTEWASELSPPFRGGDTGIADSAVTPKRETRAGRASRVRGRRD